jgi:hypothetical protein
MWQVALLAAATACGNKLPAGTQIGAIPGAPVRIQAVGDTLIIEAYGDEEITDHGPLVDILAMPMAGGSVRTLAVLLQGPLLVDRGLIYYATEVGREVGGELYVIKPEGGVQHIPIRFEGTINGLAVVDGALIVVRGGTEWSRVDLKTATVSSVTAPAPTMNGFFSEHRGDKNFLVSWSTGTTFQIARDGTASVVVAPPGRIHCVAVTDNNIWWFRQTLREEDPKSLPELYTAPIGGARPPVKVVEENPIPEGPVACAANSREVVYTKGQTIVTRTADGKTSQIAAIHGTFAQMYASETAVYWGEELSPKKWVIRSAPLP